MTIDDFRIRKVPSGYRIWQRIGPGWEALDGGYETRTSARAQCVKFGTSAPARPDVSLNQQTDD